MGFTGVTSPYLYLIMGPTFFGKGLPDYLDPILFGTRSCNLLPQRLPALPWKNPCLDGFRVRNPEKNGGIHTDHHGFPPTGLPLRNAWKRFGRSWWTPVTYCGLWALDRLVGTAGMAYALKSHRIHVKFDKMHRCIWDCELAFGQMNGWWIFESAITFKLHLRLELLNYKPFGSGQFYNPKRNILDAFLETEEIAGDCGKNSKKRIALDHGDLMKISGIKWQSWIFFKNKGVLIKPACWFRWFQNIAEDSIWSQSSSKWCGEGNPVDCNVILNSRNMEYVLPFHDQIVGPKSQFLLGFLRLGDASKQILKFPRSSLV